jgi:DNA-binding GntR family transcriptional regulator
MGAFDNYKFKPTGLGEQVSRLLTDAILDGTIKEGDKLIETKLQMQFGVSRSPIREALHELEMKGLIVIFPRKGAFVKEITRKDIEEIFPVRAALEGLAGRLAHQSMKEEDFAEMAKTYKIMEQSFKNNNAKDYWKHHHLFHEIFINSCGNNTLIGILKNLRMNTIWYRFSYKYYQEDFEKSLLAHKRIFDLLSNKDSDRGEIEDFVRKHIEDALDKFVEYLDDENTRIKVRASKIVN